MIVDRHTTATLAIVRPPTNVVPCFWCGYTRADHFGNADWADTFLRCPEPMTVRLSLSQRQLRESTYQPLHRVHS